MNPEELKLVLEAVANTTGDAKHAFFAWLIVGLLQNAGTLGILWLLISSVRRLIGGILSQGHVSSKIAEHIGADPSCDRTDADNRAIHVWVDRHISSYSSKKEAFHGK